MNFKMELNKYIIVLIFCYITPTLTNEIRCIPSDNCICSTVQANYESQCPMDYPDISMAASPDRKVYVQCNNNISWDSSDLPLIEVGNSQSVHFRACPFPNTNFLSVMNKLGINNTRALQIDFTTYFQNTTLTSDYFYNLGHLEKLLLNSNDIEDIDDDAFKALHKLSLLSLTDNKIHLTPNLFRNLTNLTVLELSRNGLTKLPPEIFEDLTNLKFLNMWANKLTNLDKNVFKNLQNLQSVELLNNYIEELPEDIFYNLNNLTNVSLAMNRFRSIPENLFAKNKLLYFVNLSRNQYLTHLPNGLFSNLTKLGIVSLNSCNLSRVPDDLFHGSINLKRVHLQQNHLERLPRDLFKHLEKLTALDLSYNRLVELPDTMFSSLTELKSLNMEYNLLDSISRKLFASLYKLEEINLRNNRISYIHPQAFQPMGELKTVLLSYNSINFPENYLDTSPFNSNVKLVTADLSHNNITDINEDWTMSKTFLKELNLSYNQITSVEFRNMMAVSRALKMDLSYNQISSVDFGLAEVMARGQGNLDAYSSNNANNVVFLNGNPIACDCRLFDFVKYFEGDLDPMVKTLVTVVADDLTCVSPDVYADFPVQRLKTSMLTCTLDQLPENFTCPDKCDCAVRLWDKAFIVDCINRNLSDMPEIIIPNSRSVNQTIVYLQRNMLKEGPKPKMGYENVTKLHLSSNNINRINWIPPKIEILKLDHNNISHINYDVISMMNVSTLTNISLGDNPWDCDCKATNLTSFLVSHLTSKQIDANYIRCRNNGKLMVHLSNNDLCPTYMPLVLGTTITLALFGLVVAVLAAFYYSHEQEIKIWMFAHNICLWFVTEEEVDKEKLYDAFISYSHKDEDFVLNELVSILEQSPQPYKLCLHIRDWIAGEFIPKQIARSVEDSRRTIVILSSHFLQSVWGKMEFRTAHTQAMAEGRARVIVILYGDIDMESDLDDELKAYIKTNTYVKWGDPWFWDKLRYALPHSRVKITKRAQKNQNIMISLNDKLDLITAIPSTPNPGSTPPAISMDPLILKNNPLDFRKSETLTPPAEAGLNPLLVTVNK